MNPTHHGFDQPRIADRDGPDISLAGQRGGSTERHTTAKPDRMLFVLKPDAAHDACSSVVTG